jgi:epoxyqueuosine reductase
MSFMPLFIIKIKLYIFNRYKRAWKLAVQSSKPIIKGWVGMITQAEIIEQAEKLGFGDIGFTSAAPFTDHGKLLAKLTEEYAWTETAGLDLKKGVDPKAIMPGAKTIIVLIEPYFKKAYPASMEPYFGRCYLDDDRITKDGLAKRIKAFRQFLRDAGIESKVPFNLPHRVAAARAGLGTFGKNCLFYSNKAVRQGSWTLPIAVVIDQEFTPGIPTIETGCPSWCKNACIAACPTRALKGNSRIDPRKCISYRTYYGEEITPLELREPMGMFIYGCDRCQNVCPRNQPWLAQTLPLNEKVVAKAKDFDLPLLLHMDKAYFKSKIWPHMFYMGVETIWKWKMNVARVMGNSCDEKYLPDLDTAFNETLDDRVKGMIAWAMGQIGNQDTLQILTAYLPKSSAMVSEEIQLAVKAIKAKSRN